MSKTAILILAAGASERFGKPKQLLPYKETVLLNYIIEQLIPIKNAGIFVMIGAYVESVFQSIKNQPVTVIKNADWKKGMGDSLAKGVAYIAAKNDFHRVLVTLGDLPLITTQRYTQLIALATNSKKRIILTAYKNLSGVPAIFDKSLFHELSLLTGEKGAKSIVNKYQDEILMSTSEVPFFDVDTDETYKRLLDLESDS
ncbi:MAG: NTP transferase domain-containing protein [Flavobacteriaceae bacterium]|nr:MAG: NTP transferase domain-containing protein [Flavobacteriaceae bacterium]